MSKRSYVKDNVVYDCGLPKSPEECSAIINNLEETTSKWQHKCEEKEQHIEKLEDENQKLKSQPAEIVEKIRKWGQKHYNWVGDGTGYDGQDYNECIGFNMAIDQLNEVLDTILKALKGE